MKFQKLSGRERESFEWLCDAQHNFLGELKEIRSGVRESIYFSLLVVSEVPQKVDAHPFPFKKEDLNLVLVGKGKHQFNACHDLIALQPMSMAIVMKMQVDVKTSTAGNCFCLATGVGGESL